MMETKRHWKRRHTGRVVANGSCSTRATAAVRNRFECFLKMNKEVLFTFFLYLINKKRIYFQLQQNRHFEQSRGTYEMCDHILYAEIVGKNSFKRLCPIIISQVTKEDDSTNQNHYSE